MGFSSGLPLALTFGTLSYWLAELGVSRGSVSLWTRDVPFTPGSRRRGRDRGPNVLQRRKEAEIEAMLERHPDIHQAVVVPIDDELKFKKPVAFVMPRPGAAPSEAAIQQFALANAAPYLHPRRVWFVPEMPLAGTNKIDRQTLAKRAAALLTTS